MFNYFKKVSRIKILDFVWSKLISYTRATWVQNYLYKSYWHSLFNQNNNSSSNNYYSSIPNKGAGIGHQLANWNSGYWFSSLFELKFAHSKFSNERWDNFLGFGDNEVHVEELRKNGYKKIRLPYFNEKNSNDIAIQRKIINSYSNKRVVFVSEKDQFYSSQVGIAPIIKNKFNTANSRKSDNLIFSDNYFNIALHVRRLVVIDGKKIEESAEVKKLRWLEVDYYEKLLTDVLFKVSTDKKIKIYIFSTKLESEFSKFSKFGEVVFCQDMNEYDSFLHLVRADLLITSKSSFSYKAALISDGIKFCPRYFWHDYPNDDNWILVDNDGSFDANNLK